MGLGGVDGHFVDAADNVAGDADIDAALKTAIDVDFAIVALSIFRIIA
jgi:hypothetical protein